METPRTAAVWEEVEEPLADRLTRRLEVITTALREQLTTFVTKLCHCFRKSVAVYEQQETGENSVFLPGGDRD